MLERVREHVSSLPNWREHNLLRSSGVQFGNIYWDVKYWYKFDNNLNSKNLSYRLVHSDTKDIHVQDVYCSVACNGKNWKESKCLPTGD